MKNASTPGWMRGALALLLSGALGASALEGQATARGPAGSPVLNHNVIVLDAAHGGPDGGAKLADHLLEKDVTLELAARLRAALVAAGFTVVSTREADPLNLLTNDQRVETANRAHAVACLVLHATGTGSGVHLYTSQLETIEASPDGNGGLSGLTVLNAEEPVYVPVRWDQAQMPYLAQSAHMASDLATSLATSTLPTLSARARLQPLDSLECPAVAVEVAPLAVAGADRTPVSDPAYQQRLTDAVARAMTFWRGHVDLPASARGPAGATP